MAEVLKPKEKIVGFGGSISYLVDLITQISKYLTKGRGLSRNGVNALLLFILTASLLYAHTEMPTRLIDILKLYSIPLIFLLYAFVDLLKNIDSINKFFRRLQQKTDFIYDSIMEGTISHEDLGYYLSTLSFSSEQIKNIVQKLVDSEQFTPNAQNNLLHNKAIYRIDSLPVIKESLTNMEWASSAVCVFLSNTNKNLSQKYLDKLKEKYSEHPSVLVALGYFHNYRKGDFDVYYKIGYEFKYTKYLITFLRYTIIMMLISFVFLLIASFPLNPPSYYSNYVGGLAVLILIMTIEYFD